MLPARVCLRWTQTSTRGQEVKQTTLPEHDGVLVTQLLKNPENDGIKLLICREDVTLSNDREIATLFSHGSFMRLQLNSSNIAINRSGSPLELYSEPDEASLAANIRSIKVDSELSIHFQDCNTTVAFDVNPALTTPITKVDDIVQVRSSVVLDTPQGLKQNQFDGLQATHTGKDPSDTQSESDGLNAPSGLDAATPSPKPRLDMTSASSGRFVDAVQETPHQARLETKDTDQIHSAARPSAQVLQSQALVADQSDLDHNSRVQDNTNSFAVPGSDAKEDTGQAADTTDLFEEDSNDWLMPEKSNDRKNLFKTYSVKKVGRGHPSSSLDTSNRTDDNVSSPAIRATDSKRSKAVKRPIEHHQGSAKDTEDSSLARLNKKRKVDKKAKGKVASLQDPGPNETSQDTHLAGSEDAGKPDETQNPNTTRDQTRRASFVEQSISELAQVQPDVDRGQIPLSSPRVVVNTGRDTRTPRSSNPLETKSNVVPMVLLSNSKQSNPTTSKWLKRHGSTSLDDVPSKDTHFVCVVGPSDLVMTAKLLRSLALGKLVVTDQWIVDSKTAGLLLDPRKYTHPDLTHNTSEPRDMLFRGYALFFTDLQYQNYGIQGWSSIEALCKDAGAEEVAHGGASQGVNATKRGQVMFIGGEGNDTDAQLLGEEGYTVYHKDFLTQSVLRGSLQVKNSDFKLKTYPARKAPAKKKTRRL
ncbi:hypothetical protein K431DRAFT_308835 [Polychaeton citri CBS 116435]|uniref:BRCT domain-containing protein n=1 Tax=Polychaeton citri CBS 116435 TaxID=1314669 RepID=A0A9P4QHR2_9PEZI|nr:hypothetical protein K431DRAFT_308835 [Polychaeton citri CBS 116435]